MRRRSNLTVLAATALVATIGGCAADLAVLPDDPQTSDTLYSLRVRMVAPSEDGERVVAAPRIVAGADQPSLIVTRAQVSVPTSEVARRRAHAELVDVQQSVAVVLASVGDDVSLECAVHIEYLDEVIDGSFEFLVRPDETVAVDVAAGPFPLTIEMTPGIVAPRAGLVASQNPGGDQGNVVARASLE